jgi:hypothetical protein
VPTDTPSDGGPPLAPKPTPTVAYPLPCVGCGYELMGLPEDGPCPECGVAIGRSITGDQLFASSPGHKRALARAARRAVFGAVAGWVAIGALAPAILLVGSPARLGWVALPPLCVAIALTGLGWIGLTREDPDGVGRQRSRGDLGRVLLRLWAALAMLLAAGALVLGALTMLGPGRRADDEVLLMTVLLWLAFIGPALVLSDEGSWTLSTLARRLLEGELAARARGMAKASYACIVFGGVALAVTIVPLGGWWWLVRAPVWLAAVASLLAWGVIYHAVVRALARALRAIAPPAG